LANREDPLNNPAPTETARTGPFAPARFEVTGES
jgi:hypothetical protein